MSSAPENFRLVLEYQAQRFTPEHTGELWADHGSEGRLLLSGSESFANGRAENYVEISLTEPYRYSPFYNDLDAFTLAYPMPNNLNEKGKEPFWQQAYTNMVNFIILLYKVTDGYSTRFQIYEAAIRKQSSPRK